LDLNKSPDMSSSTLTCSRTYSRTWSQSPKIACPALALG
jgi:hypothetical protein